MKTLFVFLFGVSLFNFTNLDSITTALQSGNAASIATFFDEQVEVTVLEQEAFYDKAAAKKILTNFFATHKIVSFEQIHKGASKGKAAVFCIGNLVTESQSFRVYIFLDSKGNRQVIQELRIDEE